MIELQADDLDRRSSYTESLTGSAVTLKVAPARRQLAMKRLS